MALTPLIELIQTSFPRLGRSAGLPAHPHTHSVHFPPHSALPPPTLPYPPRMTSPAPDHPYTIAVTGASGLLASGFIRLALEQGHRIVALDRMPPAPAPSSFPVYSFPGGPPTPPYSSTSSENGDEHEEEDDQAWLSAALPFGSEITPLDQTLLLKSIARHTEAYTYTQVDLLDYDAFLSVVKEGGCDAIVHLAAAYRKHDGFGNYLDGGLKERVSPAGCRGRKVGQARAS